jgi:hypothetical protein
MTVEWFSFLWQEGWTGKGVYIRTKLLWSVELGAAPVSRHVST